MSWQSRMINTGIRCFRMAIPCAQRFGVRAERLAMDTLCTVNPAPAGLTITRVNAGGVRAQWLEYADARPDRAVIYYHGGGYYFGSFKTHRALAACIARTCQARVLLVDYRLAPEHPFPAAPDDAYSAYLWLRSQVKNHTRIFLAGDSAGGGLVMATMLALRDQGQPLPTGAICISPFLDLTMSGETYTTKADQDPWFTRAFIGRAIDMYLGGTDPCTPLASPLFGDLGGLPPILIQVGTREILQADSTRLAQKAHETGLDIKLEVWQDMSHVWHAFSRFLPEARDALQHIGDFVAKHG